MFSERLKAERERLGISQTSFGEQCGVKKQAQINYEKGERQPDSNYLQNAQNIGVDVGYLFTGVRTEAPKLTNEEALILEKYRQSSPEIRNKLLLLLLGHDDTAVVQSSKQGIHNSPNSQISNSFN